MADAKAALDIPFSKEEELAEKAARLKQLDILLNMDEKDRTLLDDEPEEDMPDRVVSKDVER